jgi:hypothetical protein
VPGGYGISGLRGPAREPMHLFRLIPLAVDRAKSHARGRTQISTCSPQVLNSSKLNTTCSYLELALVSSMTDLKRRCRKLFFCRTGEPSPGMPGLRRNLGFPSPRRMIPDLTSGPRSRVSSLVQSTAWFLTPGSVPLHTNDSPNPRRHTGEGRYPGCFSGFRRKPCRNDGFDNEHLIAWSCT